MNRTVVSVCDNPLTIDAVTISGTDYTTTDGARAILELWADESPNDRRWIRVGTTYVISRVDDAGDALAMWEVPATDGDLYSLPAVRQAIGPLAWAEDDGMPSIEEQGILRAAVQAEVVRAGGIPTDLDALTTLVYRVVAAR